jgi:hypothetical protein
MAKKARYAVAFVKNIDLLFLQRKVIKKRRLSAREKLFNLMQKEFRQKTPEPKKLNLKKLASETVVVECLVKHKMKLKP